MKYQKLIFISILTLTITSCGWFETSDNGDLDGFWHLERIDTLSNGGVNDLSNHRLFWGFQYKLVNMKDADGVHENLYLRFNHSGGTLTLYSPYVNHWHENDEDTGGDTPTEDVALLKPYGINSLEENFVVEHLSGSKMTLRSETLRLSLRKF